jgi:hypothetical protein
MVLPGFLQRALRILDNRTSGTRGHTISSVIGNLLLTVQKSEFPRNGNQLCEVSDGIAQRRPSSGITRTLLLILSIYGQMHESYGHVGNRFRNLLVLMYTDYTLLLPVYDAIRFDAKNTFAFALFRRRNKSLIRHCSRHTNPNDENE